MFTRILLAVTAICAFILAAAPADAAIISPRPVTPYPAWQTTTSQAPTCGNGILRGHVMMMHYRPCASWR